MSFPTEPPTEPPPVTAQPITEDSWLNGERYTEFVTAYAYASLKTRAIPALSAITPEDAYYVWLFIQRGMERQHESDREGHRA